MKNIAILGSTGSIGTQSLEVINTNKSKFKVILLSAHSNVDLLIQQAVKSLPEVVVIYDDKKYSKLKEALDSYPIKVYSGKTALEDLVQLDSIDIVLTAMVGFSGLIPTINAIIAKKTIALANKETMVVAGELISKLAENKNIDIYPVDSEHSAIFQCLAGENNNPIEKIILTASGGPFLNYNLKSLQNVKKEEALKHPNWCMGNKITIDSATLMNKGLETIEAKWLFNLNPSQIEVVIHAQSIIHSLVQFEDGSIKAQMGLPDMRLPILYALSYPDRIKTDFKRFSFSDYPNLTFGQPDLKKFRNLALAFEALEKGGNIPCALNAANEIAVEYFLQDKVGFIEMSEIIEKTINNIAFIEHPTLDDYLNTDYESRKIAENIILKK
ncbi:MAG: 1-deoxy-D-xylulose-5-phosphate reductoisomerase [Bacteroidales bacterium]|nr:1-deoxy-D-xylulose-5-phosphate reductoisomerase [Bacteroidales bacterium]